MHYTKEYGLISNEIISAYEDAGGRLWFGSLNGGLIFWDRTAGRFEGITQQDGLPNDNVYGMLEDDQGLMWVTTNKGLSRFNPDTRHITNYDMAHGLPTNQFNFKSFFRDDEGWMYFGTIHGLCYFHPDSLALHTGAPEVFFTDLKLFNKSVPIREGGILTRHIDQTGHLNLRHRENVITLEFLALNYFSVGNNRYAYYLEGFEKGWNDWGHKQTATYTNLSPGDYTFHLKALNIEGTKETRERTIRLTVLPPFWQSNWALAIYALLIGLAVVFYTRFVRFIHRQKMALQLEKMEKAKIREINQHKLNFFTYITHEFKTPLTLIIASVEKFMSGETKNLKNQEELSLVRRNASRLHALIDQLMEFRKIETDHATLELRKGDVILFLRDTFSAFTPLLVKKHIQHRFHSSHPEYFTYFDPDKLEKIITNLLSNAIKSTSEYGEVSMTVIMGKSEKAGFPGRWMEVLIADTGPGIHEEDSGKIFSPFYQCINEDPQVKGSGIGLTLVNSLVNYLQGKLHIESSREEGTEVCVQLPLYTRPVSGNGAMPGIIEGNKSLSIDQDLFFSEAPVAADSCGAKVFRLMIVEDNKELLRFLSKHFAASYEITAARNGREALEKVAKNAPDLIISDVMMPRLDGIELCKRIKSEIHTSHIPFILLTAKSGFQHRLEGLDVGAEVYLPKPFSIKEIDLIVKNMLESRDSLRRHFLQFGNLEFENIPIQNKDREFLRQICEIVDQHFDDPDLTIPMLAKKAGISRSLLHLKLKKLVNLSASEFIKTIRLKKAAQLLQRGESVAEVAYKVGFSDPNYFSRTFKKKYKTTPSEYKGRS